MKKKFFQINIEKNEPIAGPEIELCPRQCTVCPDVKFSSSIFLMFGGNTDLIFVASCSIGYRTMDGLIGDGGSTLISLMVSSVYPVTPPGTTW